MLCKKIILMGLYSLCLIGCGWRPVYYQFDKNTEQTSMVEIAPVSNEDGRLLIQKLKDILNPQNEQVEKKYTLKIELSEHLNTEQGIIGDSTSTRATMRMSAQFKLIDKAKEAVLIDESTFAESSYNILTLPYPTVMADEATRKRLLDVVAEQIGTRIAVFFAENKHEN